VVYAPISPFLPVRYTELPVHKRIATFVFAVVGISCLAQGRPQASDYYYCASFYRGTHAQIALEAPAPLRQSTAFLANHFDGAADILSHEVRDESLRTASAKRFESAFRNVQNSVRAHKEFFVQTNVDCQSMWQRQEAEINRQFASVEAAQRPLITHDLVAERVTKGAIAERMEFLRRQNGALAEERKDLVTLTFFRQIGDSSSTARHVFTKEGHRAHPAVVFVLVRRKEAAMVGRPIVSGSYAGSRSQFEKLLHALVPQAGNG